MYGFRVHGRGAVTSPAPARDAVEEARTTYLSEAANAAYSCNGSRRYREHRWLIVDAMSISYDLAVAVRHAPAPESAESRAIQGIGGGRCV